MDVRTHRRRSLARRPSDSARIRRRGINHVSPHAKNAEHELGDTLEKIVSQPLNRNYTSLILNQLLLVHRDFFDILVLTDNRNNDVSPSMRARLYILDNIVVRTYEQIRSDSVFDGLPSVKVFPWSPSDIRVARSRRFRRRRWRYSRRRRLNPLPGVAGEPQRSVVIPP